MTQRKIRHKHNYDYVVSHDSLFWITNLLKSLAKEEHMETEMNKATKLVRFDEIVSAYKAVRGCICACSTLAELEADLVVGLRWHPDPDRQATERCCT